MSHKDKKVEMRVPAAVGRLVTADAPRDLKVAVASGTFPLGTSDLVLALLFYIRGKDSDIRSLATETLKGLPVSMLKSVVKSSATHPQVLDLVARYRMHQLELMEVVLTHPQVMDQTLIFVAQKAQGGVLSLISGNQQRMATCPELTQAIIDNPKTDLATKLKLGWVDPDTLVEEVPEPIDEDVDVSTLTREDFEAMCRGELTEGEFDDLEPQSKFQMLQELPIAEKIKMALTGDKEWRGLLVKEANRMVAAAVLKNPRVTDPEVVNVARNRTASEELIRIILLNREWMKHYEVKKALVEHPRTPLQKSMKLMENLIEKDLKVLAKSRNVSQPLVNNARRLLMAKSRH